MCCHTPQAINPNLLNCSDRQRSSKKTKRFLHDFAPDGVYLAILVTKNAVRSYRTLSPLPDLKIRRFAFCGTFPRVAPAGRYPASFRLEPGLSSPQENSSGGHPAVWNEHYIEKIIEMHAVIVVFRV